jgi:maltooligosyltrehalose synthase
MSDREPAVPTVRATYRLQFHKGFTFRDATALVPYLARLGISHIYASPLMEARPGSTHGYDIVNHNRLNPEIGTEAEFAALVAALKTHAMGLILDIVPNHMAVGGADNAWWLDVLEWGEASPYAEYFDINWDPLREDLKDRVLLPVLGDQYGAVLERDEIELRFDATEGSFSAWYYQHRFPLSPPSYAIVLQRAGEAAARLAGEFAALHRLDPAAEGPMTRLYQRLAGRAEDFDAVLYVSKKRIMQVNLASELNVLARRFHRLAASEWQTRDFTLNGMLSALEEVIAAFPVYRTYVGPQGASADDRRYIDWAIGLAKTRWGPSETTILDFIQGVLLADLPGHSRPDDVLRTAMQFQQVTGPVMAKAFEDTAFYRYFRLLSLNEVGGDPRRFGMSCAAFHHLTQERARQWPRAMLTTATHDTKRSCRWFGAAGSCCGCG